MEADRYDRPVARSLVQLDTAQRSERMSVLCICILLLRMAISEDGYLHLLDKSSCKDVAVAYTIEWRKYGAIKQFTGMVSFDDVIQSEREISSNSKYMDLRYVVSDYLNARQPGMSDTERRDIRALRLGGFYSNPRIKFAFVTDDINVKSNIEKSILDGETLHATQVFKTMEDAMAWAAVL